VVKDYSGNRDQGRLCVRVSQRQIELGGNVPAAGRQLLEIEKVGIEKV
jgi:hypothetical protein